MVIPQPTFIYTVDETIKFLYDLMVFFFKLTMINPIKMCNHNCFLKWNKNDKKSDNL